MGNVKTKEQRIKEVFDIIQADPSKTLKEAMILVGYSESYASVPQTFKNSQVAKREYALRFPDKLLAKVHNEGLKATTKKPHLIDRDEKGRPVYEYVDEPDFSARHKYLDSAYKLRGDYAPEKKEIANFTIAQIISDIQEADDVVFKPKIQNAEPVILNESSS